MEIGLTMTLEVGGPISKLSALLHRTDKVIQAIHGSCHTWRTFGIISFAILQNWAVGEGSEVSHAVGLDDVDSLEVFLGGLHHGVGDGSGLYGAVFLQRANHDA